MIFDIFMGNENLECRYRYRSKRSMKASIVFGRFSFNLMDADFQILRLIRYMQILPPRNLRNRNLDLKKKKMKNLQVNSFNRIAIKCEI